MRTAAIVALSAWWLAAAQAAPAAAQERLGAREIRLMQVAVATGTAGDVISTARALSRGFREGNPLYPRSAAGIAAVEAAEAAAMIYALGRWGPNHPRLARVGASVYVGIDVACTVWNVRLARRWRVGARVGW